MGLGKRDREFLRGLMGPKHWSEADARRALSLHAASGLSRSAFAREFELTTTRLAWWARRLAADDGVAEPARELTVHRARARFVELVASEPSVVAARVQVGAVEVVIHRLDSEAARFVVELSRQLEVESCS